MAMPAHRTAPHQEQEAEAEEGVAAPCPAGASGESNSRQAAVGARGREAERSGGRSDIWADGLGV